MLKEFPADLHIHSCLSPCASSEMIPPNIINMAKLIGLKIIAICDHNSSKNVEAFMKAAGSEILVIPGMEVQTVEEVHVLCYFRDLCHMEKFDKFINEGLLYKKNVPEIFGSQLIIDEKGDIRGVEEKLLLTSVKYSINEVYSKVKELEGIFIPAHIDRMSYSIISNLGFIPPDIIPDAIEISKNALNDEAVLKILIKEDKAVICSSDAHNLIDMALPPKTFFLMEDLNISEFFKCIKEQGGRRVAIRA